MNDGQQERRKDDPRVKQLVDDVGALKIDVATLSSEVSDNTLLTKEVHANTAGLVEFFNDTREAFRLFNKIMDATRWFLRKALFPLVTIVGILYAVAHHMQPPDWLKSWVDLLK